MDVPADRKYSRDHEWVRLDADGAGTVGITDFAQDQLGDIVYLALPATGSTTRQGEKAGEVESVKSVSELFSPVGGEVIAVNERAVDEPELVNRSPHEDGWLWQVRLADPAELDGLLDAEAYRALIEAAAH